jgi:hypothetical protein
MVEQTARLSCATTNAGLAPTTARDLLVAKSEASRPAPSVRSGLRLETPLTAGTSGPVSIELDQGGLSREHDREPFLMRRSEPPG